MVSRESLSFFVFMGSLRLDAEADGLGAGEAAVAARARERPRPRPRPTGLGLGKVGLGGADVEAARVTERTRLRGQVMHAALSATEVEPAEGLERELERLFR